VPATGAAESTAISDDGRYVAFTSTATNLVTDDSNNVNDVFLKDRQTGVLTRISIGSDGTQGNDYSYVMDISADSRYIVFWSKASNLVAGDTNELEDIFLKDTVTGDIKLINLASDGTQANAYSGGAHTSADGRFVVFESEASNLVSLDLNQVKDIFVRDTVNDTTVRVSVKEDGSQSLLQNYGPSITPDGSYVMFTAYDDLLPIDQNRKEDAYRVVNPLK
jgi:Tol biopolymer transport system component